MDVDTLGGGVEADLEWRWWTLDDLDAAPAGSFLLAALPSLVRSLLAGDLPDVPIDTSD